MNEGNTITNLMANLKASGLQSAMNYKFEISSSTEYFDLSAYAIEVVLPGPKFEFYTNSYWRGNWEYRQPAGIKYEDTLVVKFMVPTIPAASDNTNSSTQKNRSFQTGETNNLFKFLASNQNNFSVVKNYNYNNSKSFFWKGPQSGNINGYTIKVTPVSAMTGSEIYPSYEYINCFVEKVMPFYFSAMPDVPYQTMNISFSVGAEMNRL